MSHLGKPRRNADGSLSYHMGYKDPSGRRHLVKAGSTKKDALAFQRRLDASLADGTYGLKPAPLWDEYAPMWLDTYARVHVKPSTYDDYECVARIHLTPFFKGFGLDQISPVDVQRFVRQEQVKGVGDRMINKAITLFKTMMNHAVEWGYVKDTPARFIKKLKIPKKEMEFLEPHEVSALLANSKEEDVPIFAVAALTGGREGEVFGLMWDDYDPNERLINYHRTYSSKYGWTTTKNSRARKVVVSIELAKILDEWKAKSGGKNGELMFPGKIPGKPRHPSAVYHRRFHPALESAGIRRIRFHDLRHTYAALMISLEANPKFIQQQLGHSSIVVTLDVYGHLYKDAKGDIDARLDEAVFGKNGSA